MDDIRFKILEELKRIGHTTEEASLNEFLSTLKTYKGTSDLGTIKEAILELIREGYVKETRGKNVVEEIKTSDVLGGNEWKSPKRFIGRNGIADKIPDVYLFLTLEGKKFLIEWTKLENDSKLSKFQRLTYFPLIVITVVSTFISSYKSCSTENRQSNTTDRRTTEEIVQPSTHKTSTATETVKEKK